MILQAIANAGVGLLMLLVADACHAQFSLTARPSQADRDQRYQEVAKEVDALERRGNILRKVIQLAQPTVVHIETKKTQRSGHASRWKRLEVGSLSSMITSITS